MNKFLSIFLSTCLFYQIPFVSAATFPLEKSSREMIKCASELRESLKAIQKIPEAQALLNSIQREGPIQIIAKNTSVSSQFSAFWDPNNRIICIAISPKTKTASLIGSLLFELHNASVTSKIDQLDKLACERKIDKSFYVKSMEYLEYINSLNTRKIAEKGIQMGVLPSGARLTTYSSFDEHFRIQKQSGHSAHFARNYDELYLSGSYKI